MEDDSEPPPDLPSTPLKSPRSAPSSTSPIQPAPDPDSSPPDLSADGSSTGGAQIPAAPSASPALSPSDEEELVDWDDDDDDADEGDDDDDADGGEVLLADNAPSSKAPTSAGLEAGHAVPPSRASSTPSPGVAAPALVHAAPGRGDRLKSILVQPLPGNQILSDRADNTPEDVQHSPRWQAAKTRRRKRNVAIPPQAAMARQDKTRNAAREAFKKRLAGRCYRCFAPDHLLAQCREPVRCWQCKGVGHFARHCSARRNAISASLRSRIIFPPDTIHSRISFPPLTHSPPSLQPPSIQSSMQQMPNHQAPQQPPIHSSLQPTANHEVLQRPAPGRINIVSTEGILHEVNRLRTQAVVISAPHESYHATAREVAYALQGQLRVPRHNVKVICYGSGLFLAEFGSQAGRDCAVMKKLVEIGGVAYPITPWVGQAMVINGILVQLLGHEDWSAFSPGSCLSNHGSSGPRFVPFNWAQGALVGCRLNDHHDDDSGRRTTREEPRQRFSQRSVRACVRSPPTYRQALLGEAEDSELGHGRTMSRTPSRSGKECDTLAHISDEWERCRSRSPSRYSSRNNMASQQQLYHDPLVEEMVAREPQQEDRAFDPMIQESQEPRPLSYQLPSTYDGADKVETPVRSPVSSSLVTGIVSGQAVGEVFDGSAQQPMDTVDILTRSGMIVEQFDGAARSEDAREQTKALGEVEEEETADDGPAGCAAFCKSFFKEAAPPLLPRPQTLPRRGGRGRKRLMVATRSSLRQAARPSSVPVAQRAQQKLMRELQFMEAPTVPPDVAATEYLDSYGQNLSDEAVDKIRKAARLGNKKLAQALAAMAAEMGAPEMEVP